MVIKTVKVSDKGQISIPVDIRKAAGIDKGDDLIVTEKDGKILLEKSEEMSKRMSKDIEEILKYTESVLARDWDTKEEDEAWKHLQKET